MTLLDGLAPLLKGGRLAVLGIGNELNGDDAAGVLVARRMKAALAPADDLYIVEAGPSAESFTGPLRRFAPALVVLVDAAELGLPPGSVRCYDWPDVEGLSASTHTLPPSMLAKFLVRELGCGVALVGIQPKTLDLDAPVSSEVQQAVERVAEEMVEGIRRLG